MPTQQEIDIAAHVLYDQDTYKPDRPPVVPLLANGNAATIEDYRFRAREILEAAERVRQS